MTARSEITVHLFGFVTDGGTGGFEWRWNREDAEKVRASMFGDRVDADVTEVREIGIGVLALDAEAITDMLSDQPDVWEPKLGEGRPS